MVYKKDNKDYKFEFHMAKSRINQLKHGVDFEQAQLIWDDPAAVEFNAMSHDENRFSVIGMINDKHWTAIATMRGERIRIISVRRSRKKEIEAYNS
jgi:uncharacterized DUF497 family protein